MYVILKRIETSGETSTVVTVMRKKEYCVIMEIDDDHVLSDDSDMEIDEDHGNYGQESVWLRTPTGK